jgi:lipopolysaccharide/colanic/teichoic acid biosynthesis glycosyltransferase
MDGEGRAAYTREGAALAERQAGAAAAQRAGRRRRRGYAAAKRGMDIACSLVALIALSPVFAIAAIAIKLDTKGPALFVQERVGKGGKRFKVYKFRSMEAGAEAKQYELAALNERDGPAFKMADDPRVTRVGKVLRRTCIDELPQFYNALKGDMSIVGPRPPLPAEAERYTPEQARRLAVKPGITCSWQVGREKAETFDDWVRMDIEYIRDMSLALDIKLMLKTLGVMLRRGGDK